MILLSTSLYSLFKIELSNYHTASRVEHELRRRGNAFSVAVVESFLADLAFPVSALQAVRQGANTIF